MVGGRDLVEIMGSAPDGKKFGSRFGDAVWCNDFIEDFVCGNIWARKINSCSFDLNEQTLLCIDGSRTDGAK